MAGLSAFCISSEYSSWIQLLVDNSQTTSFSSSSGACWSVCFLYLKCWALNWDLTHTFKSWFTSTACFLDLFYFDYSIIGWLYLKKKLAVTVSQMFCRFLEGDTWQWSIPYTGPASVRLGDEPEYLWGLHHHLLRIITLKYCTRVLISILFEFIFVLHMHKPFGGYHCLCCCCWIVLFG